MSTPRIDTVFLPHVQQLQVSDETLNVTKPIPDGATLPYRKYLGCRGRTVTLSGWTDVIATLNAVTALADGTDRTLILPYGEALTVHVTPVMPPRLVEKYDIYDYELTAVEVA